METLRDSAAQAKNSEDEEETLFVPGSPSARPRHQAHYQTSIARGKSRESDMSDIRYYEASQGENSSQGLDEHDLVGGKRPKMVLQLPRTYPNLYFSVF